MTRFVFPKGHPRETYTGELGGVEFVKGVAEVPAQDAHKYALVLTPYHGAAPEGSDELAELTELYAGVGEVSSPAAKAKQFEKNWDRRVKGIIAEHETEQNGEPPAPPPS